MNVIQSTDNVLLTVPQIVEQFKVSTGAVRLWIAAGRLAPIRREGEGRSGTMYFARADVGALVFTPLPRLPGKVPQGQGVATVLQPSLPPESAQDAPGRGVMRIPPVCAGRAG